MSTNMVAEILESRLDNLIVALNVVTTKLHSYTHLKDFPIVMEDLEP